MCYKKPQTKLKTDIKWNRMMATSSAAGGLKMTVHGLVYDMTAKAAKEAALGAGAVMNAAKLLKEEIGDLMVIDVGGATTDVHSLTEDSDEIAKILVAPEPEAKRTVEGDLGIFVNCHHVLENTNIEEADKVLNINVLEAIKKQPSIPKTPGEVKLARYLTEIACITAVSRHAGEIKYLYGPTGRYSIASGKDLTQVEWIIGTGRALTRLPQAENILQKLQHDRKGKKLLPTRDTGLLIDRDYIMSSVGVLAKELPREAVDLLKQSLNKR